MKTGRYRVRKTLFGKAILQAEYDTPSLLAGQIDATVRDISWQDIPYNYAPSALKEVNIDKEYETKK